MTGAPVAQGGLDARAVRARLGRPRLAAADRRVVPRARRPARGHRPSWSSRDGVRPFIRSADPPLATGRRRRRMGRRRGAGPRRRAARAAPRRCARRRRPRPRPDLAGRRPLAREPARPARRLLVAATHGRARPRLALPGHGEPIADPVGRAPRADRPPPRAPRRTAAALGVGAANGYDVSFRLRRRSAPAARRFAVAETLSHLERLVAEGRAVRGGDGRRGVTYTRS